MSEAIDARLSEARDRLGQWRQAKAELPRAREKLQEETHRLRRVEACLAEVEQQLHALQSLSVTGLLGSLLGDKQRKLDQRKAEMEELDTQLAGAQAAFGAVEQHVQTLETQLSELQGAEEAFAAALDEKAAMIVTRGDEQAGQLTAVTEQLKAARTCFRSAQKATESGKQLGQHLESLDRAVRNSKYKKRLAPNPMGAVGSLMNCAVASMGPKSAIKYVADSLRRFVRDIAELPLTDHHDDVELARIRAELEAFQARLTGELGTIASWEQIATLSVEQHVQVAMSHLKDWTTNLQSQVTSLEQQRSQLLEAA